MNIGVCVKVVPDYEMPAERFSLQNGRASGDFKEMVGLYDEHAAEVGIQLKTKIGCKLYAISYGKEKDISTLKKILSMGADELILIEGSSDDPILTAYNLANAARKYGIDVILTGRMSSDMEREVVGPLMAAILDFPFIPYVISISNSEEENRLLCSQQLESKNIVLSVKTPFVASITDAPVNLPRIPKLMDIMKSKSKPIHLEKEEQSELKFSEEIAVEIPHYEYINEFLPNEDLEETAKILIDKLQKEHCL